MSKSVSFGARALDLCRAAVCPGTTAFGSTVWYSGKVSQRRIEPVKPPPPIHAPCKLIGKYLHQDLIRIFDPNTSTNLGSRRF